MDTHCANSVMPQAASSPYSKTSPNTITILQRAGRQGYLGSVDNTLPSHRQTWQGTWHTCQAQTSNKPQRHSSYLVNLPKKWLLLIPLSTSLLLQWSSFSLLTSEMRDGFTSKAYILTQFRLPCFRLQDKQHPTPAHRRGFEHSTDNLTG